MRYREQLTTTLEHYQSWLAERTRYFRLQLQLQALVSCSRLFLEDRAVHTTPQRTSVSTCRFQFLLCRRRLRASTWCRQFIFGSWVIRAGIRLQFLSSPLATCPSIRLQFFLRSRLFGSAARGQFGFRLRSRRTARGLRTFISPWSDEILRPIVPGTPQSSALFHRPCFQACCLNIMRSMPSLRDGHQWTYNACLIFSIITL